MIKLFIAFAADALFGDPCWLYHPVRIIGKWISLMEKFLRKHFPKTSEGEQMAGVFLVVLTVIPAFFLPWLLLWILSMVPVAGAAAALVLDIFWMYQILAMGCLKTETLKVYAALKNKDMDDARLKLSWLVGRDTASLSEEEIVKATVETIAENTTDGVAAPMLFMAAGLFLMPFGAPLGFAYKAVNTLDSMVGYRNETYIHFGWCSAKTDDILNFVPARLSGVLMTAAAYLAGYDGKSAWKCFKRDRLAHLSPNSAQTESACAGAFGIQLGGTHDYFGKPVQKPTLGDNCRPAEAKHIKSAVHLMYITSLLCFVFADVLLFIKLL